MMTYSPARLGPVVRQMLDKAMEDADKLGFKTEVFDGFIGHADLGEGDDEEALAILASGCSNGRRWMDA